MDKEIGKVIHFYNKISVAVVALVDNLAVGDEVHFSDAKRGTDFTQKVESMQLDHQSAASAKKGTEAAIKVDQPLHEGALLYKVS